MGHARADYSSSHDDLSSTGGERNTDRQKEVLREEDLREGEGDGERVELREVHFKSHNMLLKNFANNYNR